MLETETPPSSFSFLSAQIRSIRVIRVSDVQSFRECCADAADVD
jgi:hypothetical protein